MKPALILLLTMSAVLSPLSGNADPAVGATSVFARVPDPGMPEGIAVRDGLVTVSTHTSVRGNGGGSPSKIFVYELATGTLLADKTITIQGQNLEATHGVLAMAFDGSGALYVIDRNPGRVLRFDPVTGAQSTYATIDNLPACRPVVGPETNCSPTVADQATFADYIVFDDAGNLYVSDFESATLWRVAPGGGQARIWFQDARLDGVFGPNGIAVDADGGTLTIAMTASQQPATAARGIIYRLPLVDAPTAGDLQTFFTYTEPATGPDGIAFGASGKLYVALAGSNQVSIIDPDGTESARFPDAVSNAQQEVPYDLPASIAFDGSGSILVTNQSFFAANAANWAVLRAWVNDVALPLREPDLT